METLVKTLAQFSPKDIEQAKNLAANLPPEIIEEFRKASDKCDAGQKFRVEFKLPIELSIEIKAEHEFGHLSDWKLDIFPVNHPHLKVGACDKARNVVHSTCHLAKSQGKLRD